jgi:cell division protein FtsB
MLRARRADKKDRLETLQSRGSSLVAQIRRDLGGGYVENVTDLKIERAESTFEQIKKVVQEARELEEEISDLNDRIEG